MEAPKINSAVEGIKKYYKAFFTVVVGLFVLYGVIYLATRKPQIPTEYKNALDSLAKENAALRDKQAQVDSAIASYQSQIFDIDYAIGNIKQKETVIKEYYHEVSNKVGEYTPTQVDSFFKARYNY